MKTFGVIMAGGSGTRFWPLSTKNRPKQFLNLSGKDILIVESFKRLEAICNRENIYIVTNKTQAQKIYDVCNKKIARRNILSEPLQKSTAVSIGFAAIKIKKEFGDGVMIIAPSDAYIKNENKFAEVLNIAVKKAASTESIITIGIKPTYPATGYGYIKFTDYLENFFKVLEFVEKPNEDTAKRYLQEANYLWNSGIFVCKASIILNEIKKYQPHIYDGLLKIYKVLGTQKERKTLDEVYRYIPAVSIDYGVMEKTKNLFVIGGDFGWSDVGSWDALNAIYQADNKGNVCVGNAMTIESENNISYSSKKLVVLYGVNNLIVAETETAVLVCKKERSQDIKKMLELLKEKGKGEFL